MSAPAPGRDWARLAERGSMGALRFGTWVHRSFGPRALEFVLLFVVAYFYLKERAWGGASRRHLQRVWGQPAGRAALGRRPGPLAPLRHYWEFAIQLRDRMVMWGGGQDTFEMQHAGSYHLFRMAREGRGALLLGSHLGSFDLARVLAGSYGLTLNAVMYTRHSERITRLFEELDPGSRVRVLNLDPTSVKTAFEIRAALGRGELVGMLADRLPEGSREEPIVVDYLGHPLPLPRSPFELACTLGCPVLGVVCVRLAPACYFTRVESIGEGRRMPRRERAKAAEELARAYARGLEEVCLAHPHQWFNFFDPVVPAEASS